MYSLQRELKEIQRKCRKTEKGVSLGADHERGMGMIVKRRYDQKGGNDHEQEILSERKDH